MNVMTEEVSSTELRKSAIDARRRLNEIEEKAQGFEEAATVAMQPRIERLGTMISALERDAGEINELTGADKQTTVELAGTIENELSNLAIEVRTMGQGNPTTVSAAIDAVGKIFKKD